MVLYFNILFELTLIFYNLNIFKASQMEFSKVNSRATTKDIPLIKAASRYKKLEINPLIFDCPPPIYSCSNDKGWSLLAKSIIWKDSDLIKIIKHAMIYV